MDSVGVGGGWCGVSWEEENWGGGGLGVGWGLVGGGLGWVGGGVGVGWGWGLEVEVLGCKAGDWEHFFLRFSRVFQES